MNGKPDLHLCQSIEMARKSDPLGLATDVAVVQITTMRIADTSVAISSGMITPFDECLCRFVDASAGVALDNGEQQVVLPFQLQNPAIYYTYVC
jgi:hypothetical protein